MILFVLALIGHWLGDFVIQPLYKDGWMAKNKWCNWRALLLHAASYGVALAAVTALVGVDLHWVRFVYFNTVAHYTIDMVTSKATHYFYSKGDLKWFWVVVGADQLAHMLCFVVSA